MFEPFQNFLERATKEYGVTRQVKAATVCHRFNKLLPKYFKNEEAMSNIRAAYYKDKILMVETTSPAWAMEVTMRKENILIDLNLSGEYSVSEIKTRSVKSESASMNCP